MRRDYLRQSLRQLLFKRLLLSLWKTKSRVAMVLVLIITAAFLSISMAEFNRNADHRPGNSKRYGNRRHVS